MYLTSDHVYKMARVAMQGQHSSGRFKVEKNLGELAHVEDSTISYSVHSVWYGSIVPIHGIVPYIR